MVDAETKKIIFQFEGKINHMYLDTKKNVTIGVGHLIKYLHQAKKLKFITRKDKKVATVDQIAKDFICVKKNFSTNKAAKSYEKHTNLILSDTEMFKLFDSDITETHKQLKYYFKEYEKYPIEVRRVLLDMAFNMGAKKTKDFKDGNFYKFVTEKNWLEASKKCKRGHDASRDTWAKNLLARAWYNYLNSNRGKR